MTQAAYVRATAAWSSAGASVDALVDACLATPTPTPARVQFPGINEDVDLPYFRGASAEADVLQRVAECALPKSDARTSERLALYVGSSSSGIAEHERAYADALARNDAIATPILNPDQGQNAQRLHASLGLRGAQYTLNTACSSAANALLYAGLALRCGQIDDALVLGIEEENRLSQQGFFGMMLATRDHCRPFDAHRNGIVLGEGIGALHLSAVADGARWQLLGGASTCDTQHPTNPSPEKIAVTLQAALDDAGITRDEITAIKAHGTGTRANDLAEALGLRQLFGDTPPPFTSLKPALGHTLGACGALETIAFLACLERGAIPATAHFSAPDPELGIAPLSTSLPWRGGIVLLNFFGFGGNNCALLMRDLGRC